jgi:hypothetical protein
MSTVPDAAPDPLITKQDDHHKHHYHHEQDNNDGHLMTKGEVKQCEDHPTKDLDIFCKKCDQIICSYCLLFGSHKSHSCLPMDSYLVECKQKILQHAKVLSEKVGVMEDSVHNIDDTIDKVKNVHVQFKQELNQAIEDVYKAIEVRKDQLVKKSKVIRNGKIGSLKKQQKVIRTFAEQLQKTAEAFESKAASLEPYDTVDSMSTFEFVANELQLKVPELWPCCNEAVIKSTDVTSVMETVKRAGEITNVEEEFRWDYVWSIVTYIALAVMIAGVSMCVVGPHPSTHPKVTPSTAISQTTPDIPHAFKCEVKDMQGVINWIGTNEGVSEYINPIQSGKVRVRYSSLFHRNPGNNVMEFGSRGSGFVSTHNIPYSWFSFDFYPYNIHPLRYTLKNGDNVNIPRNWELQASNDHVNWVILRKHRNDTSLPTDQPCATATWHISNPQQSFRYFRIMQTGPNSDGSHFFSFGDLELYGFVNREDRPTN